MGADKMVYRINSEMIQSNPEKTRERISLLDEYIRTHVLEDGLFRCSNFEQCRASRGDLPFYEGQLSHIGKHYDLVVNGRPTRIIVVGQEYGHGPAQIDLVARSEMIAGSAQSGFRERNPHMKGTASLLRLLLGRESGKDKEGESLLGGHIFDGFALVIWKGEAFGCGLWGRCGNCRRQGRRLQVRSIN